MIKACIKHSFIWIISTDILVPPFGVIQKWQWCVILYLHTVKRKPAMTKQMNRHSVETKNTARPNNSSRDMISAFMKVSLKDAQTDAHIQKKIEFFAKTIPNWNLWPTMIVWRIDIWAKRAACWRVKSCKKCSQKPTTKRATNGPRVRACPECKYLTMRCAA